MGSLIVWPAMKITNVETGIGFQFEASVLSKGNGKNPMGYQEWTIQRHRKH